MNIGNAECENMVNFLIDLKNELEKEENFKEYNYRLSEVIDKFNSKIEESKAYQRNRYANVVKKDPVRLEKHRKQGRESARRKAEEKRNNKLNE